ncbi:hypothetical protein CDG81_12800 [Actinopolyspora erythraea]|uniref:Uncharacterized protein n=1 Tax=Actinopolyspora erythraea TaxID=414996 RepID=A0A223RT40_9ACTN|nr:hypothetical protein CDG81_12800 [Actinopolyspora erythraea]
MTATITAIVSTAATMIAISRNAVRTARCGAAASRKNSSREHHEAASAAFMTTLATEAEDSTPPSWPRRSAIPPEAK